MQIDGVNIVRKGGSTFIQDPESGALVPAISGAQWDVVDYDYGGGDYGGGDWGGSSDFADYSGFGGGWDFPIDISFAAPEPAYTNAFPTFSDFGGGASDPGTSLQGVAQANNLYAPAADTNWFTKLLGGGGAGTGGAGGGNAGAGGGTGAGGFGLPGLLGLGGTLAGVIGALSGGGVTANKTSPMTTAQKAAMEQAYSANQAMAPFAQGQTPLQSMQMSLLQALASGQGLPPGYAQLVEQAFQPKLGSLYQQATEQGRRAGFYDAPGTSPAGGAILGPGLADLQGQMAQAKLGLMQSLPGLYQAPINAQIGAAGGQATGFGNLFNAFPRQEQVSQPLGAQIGNIANQGLTGFGQGTQQNQQQAQMNNLQNSFNQFLLRNSGPTSSLSGTTQGGYDWSAYGR